MMASRAHMGYDGDLEFKLEENQNMSGFCPCCGCRCEECIHTHRGECCYDDVHDHPMCNAKGG